MVTKLKKPGKFTLVLTSLILSFSLFSLPAFALQIPSYTGTATVSVSTSLNVRQYAGTSSSVIGKLYNGAKVSVTGSYYGWYKISTNTVSGWVSGQYLILTYQDKINTVMSACYNSIGVKYVFGGTSPSTGFDCSGLVTYAYSKIGISLPHSSSQQALQGIAVSRANLKQGDLVFFDTNGGNDGINHVGIYAGNGIVIQAQSGSAMQVKEASLSNSYWSSAYMTARRIVY